MAEFTYLAVDGQGKEKKGNVTAETEILALEKLRGEELYPLRLRKASFLTKEIDITIGKVVSSRDLSVFCRQFSSMLAAGVTIYSALDMLFQQTENKYMTRALRQVQQDIMKGETLSASMRKHNKIFPDLMINMVTAGESAGKLDTTFERMADHFEKSSKTEGMLRKAAVYPVVVCVVALVVMVVMLVKVIPSFMETFESMGIDMPAITMAVVHASDFMVQYWYGILALVIAIVAILQIYGRTRDGQMLAGRIAINMPLFGKLNVKTLSSLTARTMSTLIYSGMSMVESLEIVARTVGNAVYTQALLLVAEDVRRGVPLSVSLKRTELYPPMMSHMIGIGEETGELEEMMEKLSDYYDEEVEQTTETVMAALEPVIILIMAAMVGIIVAAVMAPMIAMYGNMDQL